MSALIFYMWGFYFFIFSRRMQKPPSKLNVTLLNFLKGFGLMVCGKLVALGIHSWNEGMALDDSSKFDGIIASLLFLISIPIAIRLFSANKRPLLTEPPKEYPPLVCPGCGEKNNPTFSACWRCGKQIEGRKTEVTLPQPPANALKAPVRPPQKVVIQNGLWKCPSCGNMQRAIYDVCSDCDQEAVK